MFKRSRGNTKQKQTKSLNNEFDRVSLYKTRAAGLGSCPSEISESQVVIKDTFQKFFLHQEATTV